MRKSGKIRNQAPVAESAEGKSGKERKKLQSRMFNGRNNFADKHLPCHLLERELNENMNSLVRQYLPKGNLFQVPHIGHYEYHGQAKQSSRKISWL